MSVIRRPDVLGRQAHRRITGLSGAAWAASIESAAVGIWFVLVTLEPRTLFTALAGLGVLLFGGLLRTGTVASVLDESGRFTFPRQLLSASVLAAAWLTWLLTAEVVGGRTGLVVAGGLLTATLSLQFSLERRAARLAAVPPLSALVAIPRPRTALVPALLLAIGSTALLGVTWYADWTMISLRIPLGVRSVAVELRTVVVALTVFGCCSFVAQERRLRRLLVP